MEFEDQTTEEHPSKTHRKREMHALQQVGARLTEFSEKQLDKLNLSDRLRGAIREFQRLPNSHGARRRQMQFIGRLMRDYQLDEIERDIENILKPSPATAGESRIVDDCCEQILLSGDEAINELLTTNPHLERQPLRKYHLDYCKAQKSNDEPGCDSVRARLRDYLEDQLQ